MASVAALIGTQVIGGISGGIAEGLREQQRRNEWNQIFGLRKDEFDFRKDSFGQQLKQNYDLTTRGQNFNLAGGLLNTSMQVGGSLIGNVLSYNHSQDLLDFQKEQYNQRRTDLQNEGLPMSYLHLGTRGGGLFGSSGPPMIREQTAGRNMSAPLNFSRQPGTNIGETVFGTRPEPRLPTYRESQNPPVPRGVARVEQMQTESKTVDSASQTTGPRQPTARPSVGRNGIPRTSDDWIPMNAPASYVNDMLGYNAFDNGTGFMK